MVPARAASKAGQQCNTGGRGRVVERDLTWQATLAADGMQHAEPTTEGGVTRPTEEPEQWQHEVVAKESQRPMKQSHPETHAVHDAGGGLSKPESNSTKTTAPRPSRSRTE